MTDPPPADDDDDLYARTCAALAAAATAAPTSATRKWVWLAVSVGLFAASFAGSFDWKSLLIVVGVLLVHEAGHFAGMRAFGYRNVKMFFIPFFGAAVTGTRHAVPVWQQVTVLLLGPLPGIAVGWAILLACRPLPDTMVGNVFLWFVLVNGLNLLPVVPLDGGRVVDAVLFGRQPWLAVGFRAVAVVAFAVGAVWEASVCFGLLAVALLVSLPARYRQAKQERAFGGNPLDLPAELADLTDAHRRELFGWVQMMKPGPWSPEILAEAMRTLHESMVVRRPGFWGRVGLLAVYVLGIVAAVGALWLHVQDSHAHLARSSGELIRVFETATDETRDLRARADKADPAEAARLRAEADDRWAALVAVWKERPKQVRDRAILLLKLLEATAESKRPDRQSAIVALEAEFDPPKGGK